MFAIAQKNHKANGKFPQYRKLTLLTDNKLQREESASVFYEQRREGDRGGPLMHTSI